MDRVIGTGREHAMFLRTVWAAKFVVLIVFLSHAVNARAALAPAVTAEISHVVSIDAEYYTTGPQQGRPPDGKFAAGTKVSIVREAGSYALVRSEDGRQAYVASNVIQPLENSTMDLSSTVEGTNQFAWQLYQQLRGGEGNLFFSPASISIALAMTYAGAEGVTQEQMSRTLHFPMPASQVHQGMRALLSRWVSPSSEGGYRLRIANRLWGQRSYEFLPEFLNITKAKYGAELARLDFEGSTEESRMVINRWVEEQTEDKIQDLIPAGSLAADTRLVLTNAVYFKGDWTEPFDKKQTKVEDFRLTATEKTRTPLMHQQSNFRYAAVEGLQVLELPYGNKSLSMLVLLPDQSDRLAALEAELTLDKLRQWESALRSREVIVYLPRFKTTANFALNDTLSAMGMPSAFDAQQADFSGMTGSSDLFLSAVIHKAFVDVNEEGTEAAAATGAVMSITAMHVPRPKPVFRADHPFVFLIQDNRNGAILFLGQLMDPRQ